MALYRESENGVRLYLRLTPKASCDDISGIEEGPDGSVLKAKVRAIPDKGKANTALVKLIAKWADLPKSDIRVVSGHKSRLKTVELLGDRERLMQRLQSLLEDIHT